MKTAVSIPDPVFDAAEKLARRLGLSRSELYQRALRQFIETQSQSVIRESLNVVYGAADDDATLDAAVEFAQRLSIPEDDW